MEDMTKVVLDAMGGDNAPEEIVKGAVDALGREASLHIVLVGRKEDIDRELAKYSYDKNRIEVVHAEEVIETAEPPVNAIRKKKDSSIVVGMKMVKEGQADAFVSAGSSGAILVGGQVIVGKKLKGGRKTTACAVDSYRKRSITSGRLWSERGCKTIPPCTVCENGFYLHGTCNGN